MRAFAQQMDSHQAPSLNLQNLDYDVIMEEHRREEKHTQLYAIRDIKVLLGPCN